MPIKDSDQNGGATAEQLAAEMIPADLAGAEWDRRRASLASLGREWLLALATIRARPATVRVIISEIADQNGWDDAKALDVVCEFLESAKREISRRVLRSDVIIPCGTIRDAMRRQVVDVVEQRISMNETIARAVEALLDAVEGEADARGGEGGDDGEEGSRDGE
jgi:hypothetical protein